MTEEATIEMKYAQVSLNTTIFKPTDIGIRLSGLPEIGEVTVVVRAVDILSEEKRIELELPEGTNTLVTYDLIDWKHGLDPEKIKESEAYKSCTQQVFDALVQHLVQQYEQAKAAEQAKAVPKKKRATRKVKK